MAKKNPGMVNIDLVTNAICSNGGNVNKKTAADGSTHISVYSTTENRHMSYDCDRNGNISNVHTDKNNHKHMDYKGGYWFQ